MTMGFDDLFQERFVSGQWLKALPHQAPPVDLAPIRRTLVLLIE
jgi:hypothetical protein